MCDSLNVPVKWETSTKREVKRSRKDQPTHNRPRGLPDSAGRPGGPTPVPNESKVRTERASRLANVRFLVVSLKTILAGRAGEA